MALLAAGCAGGGPPTQPPAETPTETPAVVATDAGEFEIQARTGAQGGNRSVVTLGDPAKWDRIERSGHELDFSRPPAMNDKGAAFVRGGPIPAGQAFVIEGIDVYASAAGDTNGPGEVDVRIGPASLVVVKEDARPLLQWFEGRAVVRAGRESDVSVRLANSSAADVRLHGRFMPIDRQFGVFDEPFAPAAAPATVARAAGCPAGAHGLDLAMPRAWLQLRSGAGGGNPNRVDLLGEKSMYVDRFSTEPLSLATPPDMDEQSAAYAEGGHVPRGKLFVVTQIDYAGSAKGDSNGHGELIVSLKRNRIVAVRDTADPVRGTWTGRVEIAPGEESQVFVEIANSSTADVRITGEFVDAPQKAR